MEISNIENYIFDLDGTIIDSSKEVLLCFEKAFEKANYPIDKSRLTQNVIGPPLKEILKLIAPDLNDEGTIDKIILNFRELYDYDKNDISELYQGMFEFLLSLKKQGKKLFIATFKPNKPTLRIVKQFNLNMFDDIYTIDKFGKHVTKAQMIEDIIDKYNLKKENTVMIGDAASDIMAAKLVGIKCIGVLWGYEKNKKSLKENADKFVDKVEQLKNLKKEDFCEKSIYNRC